MFYPLLFLTILPLLGLNNQPDFRRIWLRITLAALICALLDWLLLASLPLLGLSFGPVELPRALIHMVRIVTLIPTFLILIFWKRWNDRARKLIPLISIILQISILLVEGYGLYIEPFNLGTTTIQEPAPQFIDERPLRILQISDIHVERITRREEEVITTVNALDPDIIVMTGDYVNIDYRSDSQTWADTRAILTRLSAPYGIYAVSGTGAVDLPEAMSAVFDGLDIQVLDDEIAVVLLPQNDLYIIGVSITKDLSADQEVLSQLMASIPEDAYTLLLYHSPDIIETAAATGVDLYLAGHTHGGQIRLPIYGAIFTSSHYGKEYEMGYYKRGETTLYVSRGIGLEGLSMPRARFLAPPELVLVELGE